MFIKNGLSKKASIYLISELFHADNLLKRINVYQCPMHTPKVFNSTRQPTILIFTLVLILAHLTFLLL